MYCSVMLLWDNNYILWYGATPFCLWGCGLPNVPLRLASEQRYPQQLYAMTSFQCHSFRLNPAAIPIRTSTFMPSRCSLQRQLPEGTYLPPPRRTPCRALLPSVPALSSTVAASAASLASTGTSVMLLGSVVAFHEAGHFFAGGFSVAISCDC